MNAINSAWYEFPDSWVDGTDIEKLGRGAIQLLQDMIVKRPTEYSRFKKLFFRAMGNKMTLLPRQEKVLALAFEAKQLGITETRYISEHLNIGMRAAQRALKRAQHRQIVINYQSHEKMFAFDTHSAIYSEGQHKFKVSTREIENLVYGWIVDCPTQPYVDACTGTAKAAYGLCPACHAHFKEIGFPVWVEELRDSVKREAKQEARQQLFNSKYGANIDVSEVA